MFYDFPAHYSRTERADPSSTVYDLTVGILTRAINGPNVIRQSNSPSAGYRAKLTAGLAATAREVVEARGGVDGVYMQVGPRFTF